MIPMCDLKTQYMSLKSEIDAAMQAVCANTNFILGPEVRKLESEIAAANQCQFAIGVASGTDALHLALRGLNIGPGDEVITTPFTFVATTEAIGMVGATPVFVDIDPDTCNIDVTQIEAAITPRTRVILPVHLYGQACDMDTIMAIAQQHNLHVLKALWPPTIRSEEGNCKAGYVEWRPLAAFHTQQGRKPQMRIY